MQLFHPRADVRLLPDGSPQDQLPLEKASDKDADDSVPHLHCPRGIPVHSQDRPHRLAGPPSRKSRSGHTSKGRMLFFFTVLSDASVSSPTLPFFFTVHDDFYVCAFLRVLHEKVQEEGEEEGLSCAAWAPTRLAANKHRQC